jgi:hypothetical protein
MRFVMSRYVSANQERGFVNYEELIKFLARCLGENKRNQPSPVPQQPMPPPKPQYSSNANNNYPGLSPRQENSEAYDPDEQAILRLMHENMREWDQINLINCDNLRKKFYEIDPYNRYILTQREVVHQSQYNLCFVFNNQTLIKPRLKMFYTKIEFQFNDH